jgi:hypothetical protein
MGIIRNIADLKFDKSKGFDDVASTKNKTSMEERGVGIYKYTFRS